MERYLDKVHKNTDQEDHEDEEEEVQAEGEEEEFLERSSIVMMLGWKI